MTDIATALKAIGLVALVVLFNLGLYAGVYWASTHNWMSSGLFYPAFVLFLSFTLSIGIILIVALGEKVKTENIENEWIKKIGVTPIMAIVACLIAVALGFSPLATKILPDGGSQLKFLLANVGVKCGASVASVASKEEATQLLAVISSDDAPYISKVREDFTDEAFLREAKNRNFAFVSQANGGDDLYKLLKAEASLQNDLGNDEQWIAYTVKAEAPTTFTSLPIPTIYDRIHESRLFAVLTTSGTSAPAGSQAELASLAASTQPYVATKKLMPLLLLQMLPHRPKEVSQEAILQVTIFANQGCWIKGGA